MNRTVLILGGTAEANALARELARHADLRVISSLAGRTDHPRLPPGEVRIGGFGGAAGLRDYLTTQAVSAVIDATHPFAARMGQNAAQACATAGVPLLRLERPAWPKQEGDRWDEVDQWGEAVELLRHHARRVLLAVGRQELGAFASLDQVWFLIRSVDFPDPLPGFVQAELLRARGPFTLEGERALLRDHAIDTIVCKNSGGDASAAKLAAARELGLRVMLLRRPRRPDVPVAADVGGAIAWLNL